MTQFPLTYDIQRQDEYSRFIPLIKWLFVIPAFPRLHLSRPRAFFAIPAFFAFLDGSYPVGSSTTWSESAAGATGLVRTSAS